MAPGYILSFSSGWNQVPMTAMPALHWHENVVILAKFSSLATPKVAILTISTVVKIKTIQCQYRYTARARFNFGAKEWLPYFSEMPLENTQNSALTFPQMAYTEIRVHHQVGDDTCLTYVR